MISSVNGVKLLATSKTQKIQNNGSSNPQTVSNGFNYSKEASFAIKNNSLNFASTINFTGALYGAFNDLNTSMVTCKTEEKQGEPVGSRASVNKLLHDFSGDFSQPDDAIKTTINIADKGKDPIYVRTQIKLMNQNKDKTNQEMLFQMAVRDPKQAKKIGDKADKLSQELNITMTPINYKGEGTNEQAYVLNTKGNLMAVVEDNDDVILTNAGNFSKKDSSQGVLDVKTTQSKNSAFVPFSPKTQRVEPRESFPSIGKGAEIIIGMESGRFENEIKDSIRSFVQKVKNGEIVLNQFAAAYNTDKIQLYMLAGGFGSRAEYTNASSSAIFHDKKNGAQSTKGVFKTATGLTPMETTFVTLHNAGLLDCSKDELEIGKNIKFYLNKDINRGNGGYTLAMYEKMKKDDTKAVMIFPNDSMSRMTYAVATAQDLVTNGDAAIAIVAKQIPAKDAINTFGIMKLNNNNEILDFVEKPRRIPRGYEKDGKCLTNTFQFAVSKEVFEVLSMIEPYFDSKADKNGKNKETRDWSKQYIPIIKTLIQEKNYDKIREKLNSPEVLGENSTPLDNEFINKAKEILKDKKVVAVPTSEPWADCGTLNALYYTTMQIADGSFPLEDFERAHVLSCVNTKTGLIAQSKEQKERIENKYNIDGQVMVVEQAKKVSDKDVKDIPVIVNEAKN